MPEEVLLDDNGEPIKKSAAAPKSDDKGFASKVWDTLNRPLTDAPSRWADSIANYLDPSDGIADRGIMMPFLAGAAEGAGDLISNLSSPVNLATTAATMGSGSALKMGLPKAATGLRTLAGALSAPQAAHGASAMLDPASDMSQRMAGGLELASGVGGMAGMPRAKVNPSIMPDLPVSNIGADLTASANTWRPPRMAGDAPNPNAPASWMDPTGIREDGSLPTPNMGAKPKFRINSDGTVTNLETGESKPINSVLKPPPTSTEGFTPEPVVTPRFGSKKDSPETREYAGGPRDRATSNEVPPAERIPSEMRNISAKVASAPAKDKDGILKQVADFNRTLLTSFDLSAPGRQGLPLASRKEFWTSLDDMFKSWGSEKAYDNVVDSIMQGDNFQPKFKVGNRDQSLAEISGLSLSDVTHAPEEVFQSKLAAMIPGVNRSQRAYTAFLNKLRADTFNTLVKDATDAGRDPNIDHTLAKELASFINNATGRGDLGVLEKNVKGLSQVFFAPRLMASRIRMYNQMLNPKAYADADPIVRKEALRSLLTTAGTGLALGELARMGGAEVNNEPTSSDFRKIKIGNTRVDPFGGFQQYGVAASKLLTGKSTSSVSGNVTDLTEGNYGQPTRKDVVENFFANKLAPIPSFVYSWMRGKEFDGEPFEVKKALLSRTVPIVIQDLQELAKEDPSLLPLGVLPAMGVGVQTYGR